LGESLSDAHAWILSAPMSNDLPVIDAQANNDHVLQSAKANYD
jgi:hypothetical protein